MVSPNKPDVKGISETQHDDMPQAGHDAQFKHADTGSKISDAKKGSPEQTPQEKQRAKDSE